MTPHIFAMIFLMAAVVILLRWVPFLVFASDARVPDLLVYLGKTITAAAIAMLVVSSFYGALDFQVSGFGRLPAGICASLLTVILHWFFKNPLVSIVAGTALFMLMI